MLTILCGGWMYPNDPGVPRREMIGKRYVCVSQKASLTLWGARARLGFESAVA